MIETRDLLLHPIRLRIVQALVATPMTPLELKERLGDVAQATLYRHIKQLADGGLLEVTEERSIRGGVERTYRVATASVSLGDSDLESATAEDHFRYFATFVATLLSDFAIYLDQGKPALSSDRVGYRQAALWLTDEEFDTLATTVATAVQGHADNSPTPGRRRRVLSIIAMPDDHASDA